MSYYAKSKTVEWATPQAFFDRLNHEFGFTIDVCATAENAKIPHFYSEEIDGLSQVWTGTCWMNPPYGRQIADWVEKAAMSAQAGATVVCLVPARTDTRWFHELCLPRGEIRFVKNRLYFGNGKERAPFPSMLVIFRPPADRRSKCGVVSSFDNCRNMVKP